MVLTPELLVALGAFVTAFVGIMTQWRSGLLQARKDEIGLQRDEITRLQSRTKDLETALDRERRHKLTLQDYIAKLRAILIERNIPVPDVPVLE